VREASFHFAVHLLALSEWRPGPPLMRRDKSVATTIACYAPDVEMEQSVRRFDELILKLADIHVL
jgi:hypothetical protein